MQLLSDDSFEKIILTDNRPALVLFETEWSGHSQIMTMILDRMEANGRQNMRFFQMDFEQSRKTAQRFAIARVPTILILVNGEPVERIIGIVSKVELSTRIQGIGRACMQ